MPKTDKKKAARKDEATKEKRTAVEVADAAATRLREKLAKAEARAKAAHKRAAEKKTKQGKAAEAALERAFVLADKAGVVLATNTDEREWAPLPLAGRVARLVAEDGRLVLCLPAEGKVPLAPTEDESWSDDEEPEAMDES